MLIALDDGHGMNTPGKRTPQYADGHIVHENQFNNKAMQYCAEALKRCGIQTMFTAPGDDDTSLNARTDRANQAHADVFVSFHYDAAGSTWTNIKGGLTTYFYPGSKTGAKLAQCVHKYLRQGTSVPDRGIKSADFHVLRETNMPAVLCECGFMDVPEQAALMVNPAYQKECGEEIAHGICDYLGIKYIPDGGDDTLKAIVTYAGDGDVFAAVLVSQKLKCPLMAKEDFEASGIKADKVYQIGGKPGTDRFDSFKAAANLI